MSTNPRPAVDAESRSLLYVGGGVVTLVVLAVAAVLLLGTRATTTYPADSPEGTLQRYLAATDAGDLEEAHGHFSSDVRRLMDLDAFERAADAYDAHGAGATRSVFFDGSTGDDDGVVLELTVEEFHGEGLQGSTYRSERHVRMVHERGAWRIDEALVGLEPAPIEAHP